jgi:hypothetical protein
MQKITLEISDLRKSLKIVQNPEPCRKQRKIPDPQDLSESLSTEAVESRPLVRAHVSVQPKMESQPSIE